MASAACTPQDAGTSWGTRVVYFGATAAIVVLEKLAHIDPAVLPSDLVLGRFEGDVSVEDAAIETNELSDIVQTRAQGEGFFKEQKACLLRIRSIVLPEEYNYVLNPMHFEAKNIQVFERRHFTFDGRLL